MNQRASYSNWLLGVGFSAALLSGFYAASGHAKVDDSKEVLRVDGDVTTLEEFESLYKRATVGQSNPISKENFLTLLKNRKLGIRAAKRLGLEKTKEVQEQIDTILYQDAIGQLTNKEVEAIQVTDEQAREIYEKNPEVRIGHILLALPTNAPADDVKKATERLKQIQAEIESGKKSFSMAAQEYSDGPDGKAAGGDLGWHTRENVLIPQIYQAAIGIKPGKTTIVRSGFGLELIENKGVHSWDEADKSLARRLAFVAEEEKILAKHLAAEGKKGHVAVHPELFRE